MSYTKIGLQEHIVKLIKKIIKEQCSEPTQRNSHINDNNARTIEIFDARKYSN